MQLTEKELGLPWKANDSPAKHLLDEGTFEVSSDSFAWWIAQAINSRDAAFIVKSANNHHALLRALKDTQDALCLAVCRHGEHGPTCSAAKAAIDAAEAGV
jgi:hypothetical protein